MPCRLHGEAGDPVRVVHDEAPAVWGTIGYSLSRAARGEEVTSRSNAARRPLEPEFSV